MNYHYYYPHASMHAAQHQNYPPPNVPMPNMFMQNIPMPNIPYQHDPALMANAYPYDSRTGLLPNNNHISDNDNDNEDSKSIFTHPFHYIKEKFKHMFGHKHSHQGNFRLKALDNKWAY